VAPPRLNAIFADSRWFYTEDGNWDLVGNNTPVFFYREETFTLDIDEAEGVGSESVHVTK
jgi:hypothetical protein